jgi:hypothetical protein
MDLDRGALGKIDRKMLSEMGHDESWQMVRVPVSEALWSTWRRYCGVLGVSMGRGIGMLVAGELGALINTDVDTGTVFASKFQRRLVARSEALEIRARRLDERERSLRASERLLGARTKPLIEVVHGNTGRNDPCPCGSGFKYKRCHGN